MSELSDFDSFGEAMPDLTTVGESKPLGYLPIPTITDIYHVYLQELVEAIESNGIKVRVLNKKDTNINGGAVFAYDSETLEAVIKRNSGVLLAHGWPTEPDAFVTKVATENVPWKTQLYDVISDAFASFNDEGRLFKG